MSNLWRCNSCGGTYRDELPSGTPYQHCCPPPPAAPRPGAKALAAPRDERLLYNRAGQLIGIRVEGSGVTCLSNPALTDPPWIAQIKARLAKEDEGE